MKEKKRVEKKRYACKMTGNFNRGEMRPTLAIVELFSVSTLIFVSNLMMNTP